MEYRELVTSLLTEKVYTYIKKKFKPLYMPGL